MRRMSDCWPAGQPLPVAVWRVVTNLGTIIIMGHSSLIVPPVSRPPPSLTYFNSAASVMSWAGGHLPPWRHLDLGWDFWIYLKILEALQRGYSWYPQYNAEGSGGQLFIIIIQLREPTESRPSSGRPPEFLQRKIFSSDIIIIFNMIRFPGI